MTCGSSSSGSSFLDSKGNCVTIGTQGVESDSLYEEGETGSESSDGAEKKTLNNLLTQTNWIEKWKEWKPSFLLLLGFLIISATFVFNLARKQGTTSSSTTQEAKNGPNGRRRGRSVVTSGSPSNRRSAIELRGLLSRTARQGDVEEISDENEDTE